MCIFIKYFSIEYYRSLIIKRILINNISRSILKMRKEMNLRLCFITNKRFMHDVSNVALSLILIT